MRRGANFLGLLAAASAAACASPRPDYHAPDYVGGECVDLLALADEHPLQPGQPVLLVPLGMGTDASHHLAIVREEPPHRHDTHDITVEGLRGEGWMRLLYPQGERTVRMETGSLVFVPRGTVHSFRSTGERPYVAFVVFSPAFDGKDAVRVEP